jgi:hypothetical protein
VCVWEGGGGCEDGRNAVDWSGVVCLGQGYGGTWRTLHCRLCIICYRSDYHYRLCIIFLWNQLMSMGVWRRSWSAKPPPPPLDGSLTIMQRRQCIVLQIPPWDGQGISGGYLNSCFGKICLNF